MEQLVKLAEEITGKRVIWDNMVFQTDDELFVFEDGWEDLPHEIAHWIVADDWEMNSLNLALVNDTLEPMRVDGEERETTEKDVERSRLREKQACFLEIELAAEANISEDDLREASMAGFFAKEGWYDSLSEDEKDELRSYIDAKFQKKGPELREKIIDALYYGIYLS